MSILVQSFSRYVSQRYKIKSIICFWSNYLSLSTSYISLFSQRQRSEIFVKQKTGKRNLIKERVHFNMNWCHVSQYEIHVRLINRFSTTKNKHDHIFRLKNANRCVILILFQHHDERRTFFQENVWYYNIRHRICTLKAFADKSTNLTTSALSCFPVPLEY